MQMQAPGEQILTPGGRLYQPPSQSLSCGNLPMQGMPPGMMQGPDFGKHGRKQPPMHLTSKLDEKIEEYKRSLLLQLHYVNDYNSILVESKNKSIFLQTRSQRGSRFRGVSKNGSKWQVMIVRGEIKKYIGAIESEEIAARFYDKYALIIQGFEVRNDKNVTSIMRQLNFTLLTFLQTKERIIVQIYWFNRQKQTSRTLAPKLSN